jgi:hypothetical protein
MTGPDVGYEGEEEGHTVTEIEDGNVRHSQVESVLNGPHFQTIVETEELRTFNVSTKKCNLAVV